MIFDSPSMLVLRNKYAHAPDYRVPKIVFLDRSDELAQERAYLEHIVASVRVAKQSDWIGRLLSEDHAQFMGAWFEMMLWRWLQERGDVEVEPQIDGAYPDFAFEDEDGSTLIHDVDMRRHRLQASYVQNPFASVPVDGTQFSVESRFVLVGNTGDSYQMKWLPGDEVE